MRIEWMVLGEGVAHDARNALTVVGISQDLFVSNTLPAATKRAVVTRITDLHVGQRLQFRLELLSPRRKIISVQDATIDIQDQPFPDVPPTGMDVPVEIVINVREYGTYTIRCEVTDAEQNISTEREVRLMAPDPQELGAQPNSN